MNIFKNKVILTFTFFVLIAIAGCKKDGAKAAQEPNNAPGFRVVGYIRYDDDLLSSAGAVDMTEITHLNVAFVNPDANGVFTVSADLKKVAAMAHNNKVQILASIAGGNPPAYFSTLTKPANQAKLIAGLVKLVTDNDLDGIDVDIEQGFINENYESFVIGLGTALKAKSKLMTAAIATAYKSSYTDKALAQFDFVNVMSYDKTGPWAPANPGQHAPFGMVVDDLNYWEGTRKIAKEKISLGVPFYGYGFGTGAPEDLSYGDIVATYPSAISDDQVTVPGGGIVYYNGKATIKAKADLALDKVGGIMIWQLSQDAKGANSLLGVINTEVKARK